MARVSQGSKKKVVTLAAVVVLALAGLMFALEATDTINLLHSPQDSSQDGPTPRQKAQERKTNSQAKENFLDNAYKEGPTDSTPDPNQATIELSAEQQGSNVVVLARMHEVANGTCTLTATIGTKSTRQTAVVIYQPEFSSCAGFSIPVSTLGSGKWVIELSVTNDSGVSISKTIQQEVK